MPIKPITLAEFKTKVKKASKYGNIKTEVDGIKFDSKREAKRYTELKQMADDGDITDLKLQVRFKLSVCTYIADFAYYRGSYFIIEDVKGMLTDVYKLKKKMMKHELGIDIVEIK
jgi:hypothetical protein